MNYEMFNVTDGRGRNFGDAFLYNSFAISIKITWTRLMLSFTNASHMNRFSSRHVEFQIKL